MMRNKWRLTDIPESKETAIITGANSGLGFELASQLAAKGFLVIMACRNIANGKLASDRIQKAYPNAKISVEALDLSDFSSIRDFAKRIAIKYRDISLLVNNAGIFNVPYSKTKDGNENIFQTNYLGPFLLTALLFPLLEKAKSSRVVTVSSYSANMGKLALSHLQMDEKDYDQSMAYYNSKLANLMFTMDLHRRLQSNGSHVVSVAAHPGYVSTNIFNRSSCIYRIGSLFVAQDVSKGIIPIAYACVARDVMSGEYYGPDGRFTELYGSHPKIVAMNTQVSDEHLCAQLWSFSEKLVDTKFVIKRKEKLATLEHDESKTGSKELESAKVAAFSRLSAV